jgi:hypothetical protein
MMEHLLGPLLGQLGSLALAAVGAWIGSRIIKPTDKQRAEHLSRIAVEAAALCVSLYPGRAWPELVKLVVDAITKAAGVPTTNAQAIERAAAAALLSVGVKPAAR